MLAEALVKDHKPKRKNRQSERQTQKTDTLPHGGNWKTKEVWVAETSILSRSGCPEKKGVSPMDAETRRIFMNGRTEERTEKYTDSGKGGRMNKTNEIERKENRIGH